MDNITELHVKVPAAQPTPLSSLYALLPLYFAIYANNPGRKTLDSRRQHLATQFASYSFEELKDFALEVYRHKKLRGVASEAEFLAEVAQWQPFHFNAAQLVRRD